MKGKYEISLCCRKRGEGHLNNHFRIKVINFIFNLQPNDKILSQLKEILIYSNNFITIKNSHIYD